MATVLICVLPAKGHVGPTLPAAEALVRAGHTVRVLTGRRYLGDFTAVGATAAPLPEESDFGDGYFPEREGLRGIRLARFDLTTFVTRMGPQLAAIDEVLAAHPIDVVLCDPLLMAGLPLTMRRHRPPVLVLGFLPLTVPLPGLAPPRTFADRVRALATRAMMPLVLRPVQATAEREVRALTGRAPEVLFLDWPLGSDGILQMTCRGFEVPQGEQPMPVEFVGPLSASDAGRHRLPPWWSDVDGGAPVVLVTQGSVANTDLGDLVVPTLKALADRDVLVVVSTGGAELPEDRLPANARAARSLPYDDLLPRCALMVTNGGYGGVNHALRHGVPLVCVGATEDKSAVVARVRWSGAGVGLTRRRVSARTVGKAIERVLGDPRYRARARALAEEIAACPGTAGVVAAVERVTGQRGE
ncbi:glycosyltransferase [Amycolatopsis sp. NPDC058986]|uniref:glycosyltransferase n=1 Tax=unclassified Amycolatopsis TaxID=2618356 RepID=UPI00366D9116